MRGDQGSASQDLESPLGSGDPREELIRRVTGSTTFEKAPKLRAFLEYVCRCALGNHPEAATEQQIGIYVFGRPPGYNPNEDNIVRSQARLLRLKLEHHFANEGKDEPVLITVPKGRYFPVFEQRVVQHEPPPLPSIAHPKPERGRYRQFGVLFVGSAVLVLAVWTASTFFWSRENSPNPAPTRVSAQDAKAASQSSHADQTPAPGPDGEIRIAAGNMGLPYTDRFGRRWDPDHFYEGGIAKETSQDLFLPVPNSNLFRTLREGASLESMSPEARREFRYDIPLAPGVYELRLYFSDPTRWTHGEDAENTRHFDVNVNGRTLLEGFDAIADAGSQSLAIRAFKDITPAPDGKVHLEFLPGPEAPFVNALELIPGIPGKMKPIRLSVHASDFADDHGTRWSADNYFTGGRTGTFASLPAGTKIPPLYSVERYGNFSYAIPVPSGSYTVKLHFMESFFISSPSRGLCRGTGCRVFDVTCNGVMLLKDFDIFQAAGGGFRPLIRTFHKLHANGQGKLLLTFSPKVNYAEVRAIEVIDETP